MYNASDLEEHFKGFITNLKAWLPDSIVDVNIETLSHLDLLNYHKVSESTLTRYFHVIDSKNKITLVNDQFVVWIVPENNEGISKTTVLVALNQQGKPKVELAFIAKDVYNTSRLVLRLLEKFLFEIQENEESLKAYRDKVQ
ncbi:MAG: hypothetical protein ACSNEK_07765 [Parachlamydiaceae bacterium]